MAAARSVKTGHIQFGAVTVPIKLYTKTKTNSDIRLNQLHTKDNGRISQKKECKICKETLESDQIISAYEYGPGQYVPLTKEEIDSVTESTNEKVIEIEAFVPETIDHSLYDTAYLVAPDKEVAHKAYALLRDSLLKTKTIGIGRMIMRGTSSIVGIAAQGDAIVLHKLRYPESMRSATDVEIPTLPKSNRTELKLATDLIESMKQELGKIDLSNKQRAGMMQMIEAKINGNDIIAAAATEETTAATVDLMQALKKSMPKPKKRKAA